MLLGDLGTYTRPLETPSAEARAWFRQGLMLTYGFNHDEAVAAFEEARRLDPGFALAAWGVGFALGPNINMPMTDPDVASRAYAAAQDAAKLAAVRATPVERALCEALTLRYADPPPADRAALDLAYADAMRDVHARFPDDPDVGALFADSLLNLSPWDQWTKDGRPKEHTEECLAVLEDVLATHPDHPLANHLYIHATEAGPHPEAAEPCADRLGRLVPGQGHLVHMPSHTYVRIGRYADAVEANQRALLVDDAYFASHGWHGVYALYRAHNAHFLAYAAMFEGDPETSLAAARNLVAHIPAEVLEQMPEYAEGFFAMPWHVMVRFGMWDRILAEPFPDTPLHVAETMLRYARGVALANLDRLDEAEAERARFEESAAQVTEQQFIGLSPAPAIVDVARHMLLGELRFRQGRVDEAFDALRQAVALEDELPYDEPKGWMQPVRHALGALLLEAGRVDEAEAVYRADLAKNPENGWSLHGLAECLQRSGREKEASVARERFERAWSHATITLDRSCFCRRL
ncbi:MAG: hypothetical protein H6825_09125 [Planctomycetes bacterium]|nr:hypothetical protein [Planctomycetota bacterium]